ncbi:hypothetical protein [Methylobacterium oxalidis]|uniref:Uncharacterized protein n=1 Tax=Methylobacterium oxalidis TaxID=944322 RepID=A0A512J849_9HYPH|nr:hypothetical protein [Methylobacterium oxalidis]GEP06137.1 hypothetical protein MOX02_41750 [Methylobacterium oxalidis]GJE34600.1 hypothetical protein LDDCCGHA_4812 [Methylobacterium oxalidis]GLS65156.1 hypothetical protein GCM10007888_35380 [Methylobacterium oxalidis]
MAATILADRLGELAKLAIYLCHTVIAQGAMRPETITIQLDQLAPELGSEERQAVLRLAASFAAVFASVMDEAMLRSTDAAQWTHAIAAFALEYRWAGFELRVCLGDHPDDADKDEIRAEEIEYFRPSVAGLSPNDFGRIFCEQLARTSAPIETT